MFPMAYAIQKAEIMTSWEWSIRILIDDIYVGSSKGHAWTIMSDRQKVMRKLCLHVYSFFLWFSKLYR
jgi:hypothetical protein